RTMAVADIYVQPSKYESYCIALAEARALGCAIVTTDFPSAHEQLDHGGGIISGTTEQSLFDSIKILIDDPEERKKIALQNRELFCE
ncbi:glycosyltransferase, partial [Clostridioides difficile]|nr:glycosyltransferase [Clostridioides difficile]